MSRPSLKEQRYQQVMDAYESCVARYGLDGATLERIADKADLARPLIRHNVGNRRELLVGLMRRFEERCNEFINQLQPITSPEQLVQALFQRDCDTVRLAYALIAVAPDNEIAEHQVQRWQRLLKQLLVSSLSSKYPNASVEAINAVAVGISAIYSNAQIYQSMQMHDLTQQSCIAATRLLSSLSISQ